MATKLLCGIGFSGEGEHKPYINGKITRKYNIWSHMIKRCYSKNRNNFFKTYDDCTVCEEWHNFQNFAKWYDENYYEIDNEIMQIDKDILTKGNKIYSPETCIFVNHHINSLFTKSNSARGIYPIGIREHGNGLQVQINKYGKRYTVGTFYNVTDAFNAYKVEKEKHIKQIANEYRDKIPTKLFEALMRYEVDIED